MAITDTLEVRSDALQSQVSTPVFDRPEANGTITRFGDGDPIYFQGDRADCCYRLIRGAARQSALTLDGRRHIVNFLLPGDLFGFGANEQHQFSAEALTRGTVVARYSRARLEALTESIPELAREFRDCALESIARLQRRVILLARTSAVEKVSAFLLEMAERTGSDGYFVELPMSRYDIADYLAIAVETVSRALTTLRSNGVIRMHGARHFTIVDREALIESAGSCTRRDALAVPGSVWTTVPGTVRTPSHVATRSTSGFAAHPE